MVRFVPAPDPAARAWKMGLAGESGFFLISRFKGMRGVGKRGEAPAACPEDAGSVPLRWEEVEALGGAGMWRCGSGWAICHHQPRRHGPQAGPGRSHTCTTCSSAGEFDKFFGCPWQRRGMERGGAGMGCPGAADLGTVPQRYQSTSWPGNLPMSRETRRFELKKAPV